MQMSERYWLASPRVRINRIARLFFDHVILPRGGILAHSFVASNTLSAIKQPDTDLGRG